MKEVTDLKDIPLADLSIQMKEFGLLSDGVQRVTVPIEPLDIISWLALWNDEPRVYWQSRTEALEFGALGALQKVGDNSSQSFPIAFAAMQEALQVSHEDVRYVGGMRFQERTPAEDIWAPYGSYFFFVPRFEVVREGEKYFLACNFRSGEDIDDLILKADSLMAQDVRPMSLYVPGTDSTEKSVCPQREEWLNSVSSLQDSLNSELEKVVLARKTSFRGFKTLNSFKLLKSLFPHTEGCTRFLISPEKGTSFLGASPELLYSRKGRKIKSEALAGTRARGGTEKIDHQLSLELLKSEKDNREHQFVKDAVHQALSGLCESLTVDEERRVVKVANCQHIFNGFSGRLKEKKSDLDLISALHPTPAVGGSPRTAALEKILATELFDRGWYAAPIGWLSASRAEFAVAIRSAIIQQEELSFFAGAGIVKGSEPEKEWQETEDKIAHYLEALGLD